MVGVEGEGVLGLLDDSRREGLTVRSLQVDAHADFEFFAPTDGADGRVEDGIRVRGTIGFFRHQVDVDLVADFHVDNGFVKARDHHTHGADELEGLTAVIGRVEDRTVVEGAGVVGLDGLAGILALEEGLLVVAAAAVVAVLVVAALMAFAVVVTVGAGVLQFAFKVLLDDLVGVAGLARAKFDAGRGQRVDRTAADAAADEHIDALAGEQARQSAVALSIGTDDFRGDDSAVLHFIDFEIFAVAEVLEHFAVVVGDCDPHEECSPLRYHNHALPLYRPTGQNASKKARSGIPGRVILCYRLRYSVETGKSK